MLGPILGNRASVRIVVVWEDRRLHAETPSTQPILLPHLLLQTVTLHAVQYPLGGFSSAALVLSPPHLLPTPCLLALGSLEGVWMLCQPCSEI